MTLDSSYQIIREFKRNPSSVTALIKRGNSYLVRKTALSESGEIPSYLRLQKQYEWLKAHEPNLQGFVPKVTSSDKGEGYFSYEMEYWDMPNLHELIVSGKVLAAQTSLDRVLGFLFQNMYSERSSWPQGLLQEYIREKMLKRVESVVAWSPSVQQIASSPTLVVNGKECENFIPLIRRFLENPTLNSFLEPPYTCTIHGDLTAENILAGPDGSFILIDMDTENIIHTPYLDLSKLMQSFHSFYEFRSASRDEPVIRDNTICFDPCSDNQYTELYRNFLRRLPGLIPGKLELETILLFFEASHFTRMLPYRFVENPTTLPIFYAIATELLHEFNQRIQ